MARGCPSGHVGARLSMVSISTLPVAHAALDHGAALAACAAALTLALARRRPRPKASRPEGRLWLLLQASARLPSVKAREVPGCGSAYGKGSNG